MIAGLVRIEARHTVALWLAPIMAAPAWWVVKRVITLSPDSVPDLGPTFVSQPAGSMVSDT